jgi:hypothetical protein
MWVYMFQRTEKKRQGKKSKQTIMSSIQFNNNNILEVMNFQNTLKIIWKKNHIVRHSIKTYKKKKKETIFKNTQFFILKKTPSCHEVNEFIMNLSLGHHIYTRFYIYIYKHIYTYLYKMFVFFSNMRILHDWLSWFNFLNTFVRRKTCSKVQNSPSTNQYTK